MSGHRASGRHIIARQTKQSEAAAARSADLPQPEYHRTAQLSDPSILPHATTSVAGAPSGDWDMFSEVVMTDTGAYDEHGEPILFSAGDIPQDTLPERLVHQLDSLAYYDHTLFGIATSKGVAGSGVVDDSEDCSGDATISETVARLQALGK